MACSRWPGAIVTVVLVNRMGVPFLAALVLAFFVDRGARARCSSARCTCDSTRRAQLEQVLFTIGLVFMAVAAVDYVMGSSQQFVKIPQALQGQIDVLGIGVGKYRLLIIVVCGLLTLALQLGCRAHALRQPRCAPRSTTARGARLGINVGAVFAFTFARRLGPRRARRRARRGDPGPRYPTFPLKYMIYFLIVVSIGGTSSITGPFLASLLLGIGDVAGKYYVPKLGASS